MSRHSFFAINDILTLYLHMRFTRVFELLTIIPSFSYAPFRSFSCYFANLLRFHQTRPDHTITEVVDGKILKKKEINIKCVDVILIYWKFEMVLILLQKSLNLAQSTVISANTCIVNLNTSTFRKKDFSIEKLTSSKFGSFLAHPFTWYSFHCRKHLKWRRLKKIILILNQNHDETYWQH